MLRDPGIRAHGAGAELGGDVSGKSGEEGGEAFLHSILEDDAADDNGDGGREVADEAKGGGRGGDVAGGDQGLESDEGGLKVRSDAHAGDDLVDDQAGPGGVGWEVDVEAETECHEEHAEPDRGKVLARFADEDACDGGDEGEGDDEGEEIDTGKERGSSQDGLEIKREVVGTGDEDEAVHEAREEGGDVGAAGEQVERDQGVLGDFPFDEEEDPDGDEAEDEEADDGR